MLLPLVLHLLSVLEPVPTQYLYGLFLHLPQVSAQMSPFNVPIPYHPIETAPPHFCLYQGRIQIL